MLEELKKKSIKKSLFLVIILIGIGAVLIGIELSSAAAMIRGPVVFESLEPDEINSSYLVNASIDTNFGAFMERYETNTKTHYSRTTDVYYVIWTGDAYAEEYKYMGLKVPASQESAMEKVADATYYEEYIDPVEYTGAIRKMSAKEREYFEEYFKDAGWSDEEIAEYTLPYYINVGALTGGAAVSAWIFLAAGVALFLAGVLRLIYVLRGGCLKTFKKELETIGIGEHELESEYAGARTFGNKSEIRIGRRLTFFVLGANPHVLPNDKIVWAFQRTTTHRTNGIKTGTTYEVALKNYEKKNFQISVPNEQTGQEILQYIVEAMPWVVVGYNNDLNKLFSSDYQNFLQIRYNQVPRDPYADFSAGETIGQ